MSAVLAPSPIPLPPDFPVTWQSPEEAMLLWEWDQSHFAHAVSPLGGDLIALCATEPTVLGLRRMGAPVKGAIGRRINGYFYSAYLPDFEAIEGAAERVQAAVRDRGFTMYQRWLDTYRPEVEGFNRAMLEFDYAGADDAAIADRFEWTLRAAVRLFTIHFELLPGFYTAPIFQEACARLLGLSQLEALELIQGVENQSIVSSSRLWHLVHGARAAVQETIRALPSSEAYAKLGRTDEGRAFLAELDQYLQEFGWRTGSFDLLDPSWVEEPRLALDHARLLLATATDPAEDQRRGAERAEQAAAAARARLAGNPAALAEFDFLLAAARDYPRLQEDHHFELDQKSFALMRLALMEAGRRMARLGVIEHERDLPFLTLAEVRAVFGGDHTPRWMLVAERKAEMERFRAIVPPRYLGSRPPVELNDPFMSQFFGAPVEPSRDPAIVRGLAASRGVVTGRARVIRSLAEAERLEPGDILVCDMTTPAWTPFFPILGGIVADSGGPLSHCAVVSREFCIPCVVGTGAGTRQIPDGAVITLDGAQGIVRIESR